MNLGLTSRRMASGVLLLLLASVSACGGGGSDAPDNASEADFCEAYNSLFTAMSGSETGDTESAIKALKKWAADLEKVGTPDGMPADARHGFELIIETAKHIDDNASEESLQSLSGDFSTDEKKDGDAFTAWATEQCPVDLGELDGTPTELPSS